MTLIANLRHAARNRETVTIGGGEFGPAELREAADKLEHYSVLLSALQRLTHPMADDTDTENACKAVFEAPQ